MLRRGLARPQLSASLLSVLSCCGLLGACRAVSLLEPVGTGAPDAVAFPGRSGHRLQPAHTEVTGAKETNKFWTNWVVEEGPSTSLPIFPQPYALKWGSPAGSPPDLLVSHGEPFKGYQPDDEERIRYYITPFICEFSLGAQEPTGSEGHVVVKEGLFGVHIQHRGPAGTGRRITYPIFSGMAYVSGLYEGGFTPRIRSHRAILAVEKVRSGVWRLRNNGGVEFRAYALTPEGEFVDDTYDFDAGGLMNKPLEGWLRLAMVMEPGQEELLDQHSRAVVVDWHLGVDDAGVVQYDFEKAGEVATEVLHFALTHHLGLMAGSARSVDVVARAPTKGSMRAVVGDIWRMQVDLSDAEQLDFLPPGEPSEDRQDFLATETFHTLEWLKNGTNWRVTMLKWSYYFTGKGFQKVGTVCLLLEKFYGTSHAYTQECAELLVMGFRCMYDKTFAENCEGAPAGQLYDEDWGGVPSQLGYDDDACFAGDFGNACYNDHHYHYGYFVVAGAILVKLRPPMAEDTAFVSYVETLIRDTANPSMEDPWFPVFRAFDWFDMHSWSRGLPPSADGKDQESTSEELNLLYGMHLWGEVLGKPKLRRLGTTMLALCARTIREFFLLEDGNANHPEDFVKNRVTGIFFQNKVDYTTWFGSKAEYIHGIQMLPLSPALQLTRKPEFCRQEWDDILAHLPLSPEDPWTSLLLTGTLAILDPEAAYARLLDMKPEHMDDGLTRAWALYWAAVQRTPPNAPPQDQTPDGGQRSTTTAAAPEAPEEEEATTTAEAAAQSSSTRASVAASTTVAAAAAPAPEEQDDQLCGGQRQAEACPTSPAFSRFDAGCANGGLGCRAYDIVCCRFCGFGAYAEIPCLGGAGALVAAPGSTTQVMPPSSSHVQVMLLLVMSVSDTVNATADKELQSVLRTVLSGVLALPEDDVVIENISTTVTPSHAGGVLKARIDLNVPAEAEEEIKQALAQLAADAVTELMNTGSGRSDGNLGAHTAPSPVVTRVSVLSEADKELQPVLRTVLSGVLALPEDDVVIENISTTVTPSHAGGVLKESANWRIIDISASPQCLQLGLAWVSTLVMALAALLRQ